MQDLITTMNTKHIINHYKGQRYDTQVELSLTGVFGSYREHITSEEQVQRAESLSWSIYLINDGIADHVCDRTYLSDALRLIVGLGIITTEQGLEIFSSCENLPNSH